MYRYITYKIHISLEWLLNVPHDKSSSTRRPLAGCPHTRPGPAANAPPRPEGNPP